MTVQPETIQTLADLVEEAIMQGATREQVDAAIHQAYEARGDSPPASAEIDAAYATCVDRWIQAAERDNSAVRALQLRRLDHLYERSHRLNDFKTCLQIVREQNRVWAVYREETTGRRKRAKRAQVLHLLRAGDGRGA